MGQATSHLLIDGCRVILRLYSNTLGRLAGHWPTSAIVRVLVVTSAFLLNAFERVPFADGLFETVSAFGTVGLSRGVTNDLGYAGRLVIVVTMFLGRLGSMTVGLALTARAKGGLYEYPQERVRVG